MQKIQKLILDALFPIRCLHCHAFDAWLCTACIRKIPLIVNHVCPLCERKSGRDGQTCFSCKKKYSIDGLLTGVHYRDISQAVHYFKYRFVKDLSGPLSKIMTRGIDQSSLMLPEVIIPVPLHKRRLRWRGFNQAELLTKSVSEKISPGFDIPVFSDLLIRKKYTQPQMNIKGYAARQKNMRDVFGVVDKKIIKDRRVWLVDDVCTTGATLFACAEALKRAGAKEVWSIVIARQEFGAK